MPVGDEADIIYSTGDARIYINVSIILVLVLIYKYIRSCLYRAQLQNQKSKQTNGFVLLVISHQCRQQIGPTECTSDQIPNRESKQTEVVVNIFVIHFSCVLFSVLIIICGVVVAGAQKKQSFEMRSFRVCDEVKVK